jgi:diphthine-ammonia ligase
VSQEHIVENARVWVVSDSLDRRTFSNYHTPEKAFCSWSGGKDSCLALDHAQRAGYDVAVLLNMLSEDGEYSRSHGLRRGMLESQADAMGKEILFGQATWDDYERVFLERFALLKSRGFTAGVFGDIDLESHREWVERVCQTVGLKAVLPLWNKDRETLLNDFLSSGYLATIVSVREEALGREWLGRHLDRDAVEAFRTADIDLSGENGEYHTFVSDGPIFRKPVLFRTGKTQTIQGYAFVELVLDRGGGDHPRENGAGCGQGKT